MCSILVADDHPVVLMGISNFLEKSGYDIVGACQNGIEAYNKIMASQPALAVLDIQMPGMTGIEIAERLKEKKCRTRVILLTASDDPAVLNYSKELDVRGFVLKEFALSELTTCLNIVKSGGVYFSSGDQSSVESQADKGNPRQLTFAEQKVLELVAKQKSSKEIAETLFISGKTVETHRRNIIKKLKIPPGKNALLMWAIKNMG